MKKNKDVHDVILLMGMQGLNYLAPLIVMPYLMKVLGAEKFGYIGFSLSIIQYLMLIVDFGFNLTATKQIAQLKENSEELKKIFWSTLSAKVVLLFISFIFLLVFAYAIPKFHIYSTTMMIMFLMVVGNTFSFIWFFQGIGKIRVVSIINTISKLLLLPLTFIFVKSTDHYNLAAVIQSSVYIFGSVITVIILFKNKYITGFLKSTKESIKREIKLAYPIFFSTAATSIYTALFAVILGYYSSPSEVGKYTAAEKIMRGFCFLIVTPYIQVYYPKVSQFALNKRDSAVRILKHSVTFMIVAMIAIFLFMFLFSNKIVTFLGDDYVGIELIFKIMAFAPILIALGAVLGQLGLLALGNENDKKKYKNVYFLAALVAIIAIFVLVPNYASLGATIALLLTEMVVLLGMLWYNRKLFVEKKQ